MVWWRETLHPKRCIRVRCKATN